MNESFYKNLMDDSLAGYAYHKIICDDNGIPCDYQLVEINNAFEIITGLKREDIIGKRMTQITQQIEENEADWIGHYGEIALNGGKREYERYFKSTSRWLKVNVYSPEKYYFITHFIDITKEMAHLATMESMVKLSDELLQIEDENIDYQKISDDFLEICNGKYCSFNLFDEDGIGYTTVALSGDMEKIKKAAHLLGNPLIGKKWRPDKIRTEKIRDKTISRFPSLTEFAGHTLSSPLLSIIERTFNIGEVLIIKILKKNIMIGDFTLILGKGEKFDRDIIAELYTRQLGTAITYKRKSIALKESEELHRSILNASPDAITITDLGGRILMASPAAQKIFGFDSELEFVGHLVMDFITLEGRDKANFNIGLMFQNTMTGPGEYKGIRRDGSNFILEANAEFIKDVEGKPTKIVFVVRDITLRKESEQKIIYLSYHDQLTGLYNRTFYEEELSRLDTKRNLPLSIIMGDVNSLKLINDSFGHVVGDLLLKKVGDLIKDECRASDIIARLGGDEFVVILPKTDRKEAERIIDRIKASALNQKLMGIQVSISFGCGTKTTDTININEITKSTEDHMYKCKLYESAGIRSRTIELIMNTLYEKNPREMLHSKRVSELCEVIAIKMDFNQDKINQMRIAGLLHDIGKIGIDENILNSDHRLSADEWREIKKHSETGYRILSSVNEFSEIAEDILSHHEKWDGTGYPRGLKGEEIPMQARIIAVADAYDAMTSDRTYSRALDESEAIEEIKRCAGTQFDPRVASIFIKMNI